MVLIQHAIAEHNHIINGQSSQIVVVNNPLTLHHEKLGARFSTDRVPLDYGDPVSEYWAVKRGAGLVDVSDNGRLALTGKDRVSFLNSLLTNDLSKLAEGSGQHSALLNTKARVIADLYLYNEPARIYMDTGYSPGSKVKQSLDNFVITEAVEIKDVSNDLVQISLQGPRAAQAIKEAFGTELTGLASLQEKTVGPTTIISRDRTGCGGYDLVVPVDEAEAVWQGLLLGPGGIEVRPVGMDALETLRLEAGIPRYGLDFDENTIVLEAGFKDAMSFTKGCYLGQEVVARATHIGRVNKQLVRVELEIKTPPIARSKMTSNGVEAGWITSASYSPGLEKSVAIAYANRDFAREGARVTVEEIGTPVSAVVTKIL